MAGQAEIGIIGLGVMGQMLARNMARRRRIRPGP